MEARLPYASPHFHKLKKHNRACFIIGARYPFFAFFNDTGTGKTYLAAALSHYFYQLEKLDRVLVLVPNRINKGEWARTVKKHAPNLPLVVLRGSSENKWRQLDDNPDALLFIETYSGLSRMVSKLGPRKKSKKQKLVLIPRLVKDLCKRFGGLVTDEGTGAGAGIGNHSSLPFRICRQITKTAHMYLNMTGTPFGRDPILLWSQMFLVDRGYTLGETLGLFRSAFYSERENYFGGYDYKFLKRNKPLLNRLLAHRSIAYEADQADLPQVVPILKEVRLPEDAESYYEKARDRLIAARGNFQEMKNAFLRMRQISSGFIGYHDDELGVKASFEFPHNPKLELLLATLETIRVDRKVIIYYEFTYSGLRIARELKRLDIPYLHIYGGSKDPERELLEFDDPKYRALILQNRFGQGPNLQAAQYGFYYESPVSAIMRKQTRRRIERQYSPHATVFLMDFITLGTVDQQILDFHAEGADLFEAIVRGRAKPR